MSDDSGGSQWPPPSYESTQRVRRRPPTWLRLLRVAALFVAVTGLVIYIRAHYSSTASGPRARFPSKPPPALYGVPDSTDLANFRVTVHAFKDPAPEDDLFPPSHGDHFVAVDLELTNSTQTRQVFSSILCHLLDAAGHPHAQDISGGPLGGAPNGQVDSSQSLRGWVTFEVPDKAPRPLQFWVQGSLEDPGAVFTLVAPSTSQQSTQRSGTSGAGEPFRFVPYRDPSGISLSHPTSWEVQPGTAGPMVLFIDPPEGVPFRRNINIMLQAVPGDITLQEYTDITERQLDAVPHESHEPVEDTTVSGSAAQRQVWSGRLGNRDLKFLSVWTIRGGKPWLFTYTADPERFDDALPDVERVLKSVVLP